jgi:hypothetical protein
LLLIPIMYLWFASQRYRPAASNGEADARQIELPMPIPATSAADR